MLPKPGDSFGRYDIVDMLGRGGMGVVYEAVHRDLERSVALKVIAPDIAGDRTYRSRFLREARVLARLDSRHVVRVFDVGEVDGLLFIASELIPGADLARLLDWRGPLPVGQALDVLAQIAAGLAAAHDVGVLHRDIKPSNVLVQELPDHSLRAVLCDMGIAAEPDAEHTLTEGVIGTSGYMAPERHEGAEASVASEVYALGCVLWAALSGRAPYEGTAGQILLGHLQGPVPQLSGTSSTIESINTILATSMAKRPDERHPSAAAFGEAIRAVSPSVETAQGVAQGAPIVEPPSGRPARRRARRAVVGLLAATALAVIGGAIAIAVVLEQDGRSPAAADSGPDPESRATEGATAGDTASPITSVLSCWDGTQADECPTVTGLSGIRWIFPDTESCDRDPTVSPRVHSLWCHGEGRSVHFTQWERWAPMNTQYLSAALRPVNLREDLHAVWVEPAGRWEAKLAVWFAHRGAPFSFTIYAADEEQARAAFAEFMPRSATQVARGSLD